MGCPLRSRDDVHTLKMPEKDEGLPHGFMFMRLTYLRGFEELMIDFMEEPPELRMLIDTVLAYNMRQIELQIEKDTHKITDGYPLMNFGDGLGMQNSMLIPPQLWRTYLKPCYAKMYRRCHEAGFNVYMHTDGHVLDIIPDLMECGVNVLNPQLDVNGADNLAKLCKGKLCLNVDLNRQKFPYWTPLEIDAHIAEAVNTLGALEGGLWLQAEIGPDVPIENIEAICASLTKHRAKFANRAA
ncbi:MAG: hypothetical protein GF398_17180 [Chitinivibrionales bacterium]|nr:hypothetical protein [Chitinivibrionales bacterium]